jgi:hypothetical protein
MKFSEAFPSRFLKAADLQGRQVAATIESYAMEEIGDEKKLVITFVGKNKTLVLNKTNGGVIAGRYGDDCATWVGKQVVLFPSKTHYQGKMMDCVRVSIPEFAAPPSRPEPRAELPPGANDLDDNIPF